MYLDKKSLSNDVGSGLTPFNTERMVIQDTMRIKSFLFNLMFSQALGCIESMCHLVYY